MSKYPDLPYFSCFNKGNIMVLFNSFQKQVNKTPENEIALALKLKDEYFKQLRNFSYQ
jgi:phage-related protein